MDIKMIGNPQHISVAVENSQHFIDGDVATDHFGAGNPGLDGHGRLNGQATPVLDEGIAGERMRTLRKRTAGHPERKEV